MSFNPNDFLSHINGNNGLSKPSKFEVQITIPLPLVTATDVRIANFGELSRSLSLQCESAELPGKNLVTDDVKIYGPTFKLPYQTQYNDISLTFLCSGNFYERSLFDSWLNLIMPTDTNNLRFPKGSNITGSNGYLTEVLIKQYVDVGNEIYNVTLIDAFPIAIQAQTLNWSDDGFHRLTVTFSYLRYVTERKPVKSGQKYVSDLSDVDLETAKISGENYKDRPDEVTRELVNHPALPGYKAVAAFGRSDTANQIPAGVPLDYRGGHDGGDNAQDPNVPGKDYLGGHDGGDNAQNPKAGKNYAGGGVLSGLVAAAVGGLALGLFANARRNRGGDRGPAVGQNYANRGISTPPAGKPYGEQ
jgi:hypothetical protein